MVQRMVQLFHKFPISLTLHNTENSLFKTLKKLLYSISNYKEFPASPLPPSFHFRKLNLKKFKNFFIKCKRRKLKSKKVEASRDYKNFVRIPAEVEVQLGTRFRDRFDKRSGVGGDGGGDTRSGG